MLSMNNLVYFNKQSEHPYKSLVEVLVNYLRNKFEMRVRNTTKAPEPSNKTDIGINTENVQLNQPNIV